MRPSPLLLALTLAGCAAPAAPVGDATPLDPPTWSRPAVLDPTRSGGEPVIYASPTGTLFYAAHPGYTHVKPPPGPEVLTPSNAQSYLWRSTDDGATWQLVTAQAENAPRNAAPGFSDPDVVANEDGSLVVWTDLQIFAGISTAASRDDGATWPDAQPAATSPGDAGVDRPWLAFANGTFYLLCNGDGEGRWRLRASEDGIAWRDHATPGDGSFPGAMIGDPRSGALYIGNGDKVWWSADGGRTFEPSEPQTGRALTGIVAQRPAVDDAGHVYFAWSEMGSIWYAASTDGARTWGAPVRLVENGTHIWPWPIAGAQGRLGVVWLGTEEVGDDPAAMDAEWAVHVAIVDAAAGPAPRVHTAPIADLVAHRGGICLNGTICEAQGLDRRLGDFISATVGRTGDLHVAYGTTETGHSISSPGYVRQTGGFRLR